MADVKKNLAMMGALVGVVILMMKLRGQAVQQVTNIDVTAPEVDIPAFGGFNLPTTDPFLLPYLQTNPGIWDGGFSSDPFDKVFNVNVDNRPGNEKYIPIFGLVGGAPSPGGSRNPNWMSEYI